MIKRLVVLGIDAMDPDIARILMAEGKLPNFSTLNFAPLQTTTPPETPVAWSAAASGSNPGRYGIFDFLGRNLDNYAPKLTLALEKPGLIKNEYTSAMRGTPFWSTLGENKIKTTVLRWPVTFPAEKVNGRLLSGLGVVDLRGSLNSYSFYTEDESKLSGEGKEKVVKVTREGETITTELAGPLVRKRGKLRSVNVPLEIKLATDVVELKIQNQVHEVPVNEWSDIFKASFKVLPFHEVSGIFNVYVLAVAPHFEMYVSSVQIDPEDQAQKITYPEEYGKELVEVTGRFQTLGMAEDTKAVTDGKLPPEVLYKQVACLEAEREAIFNYEFERFEEGLLAAVFDSGDRLKHIAWEDCGDDKTTMSVPKAIEDYYVEKDKFLGTIISRLNDSDELIVLSDHGFSNFSRQFNLNSWFVKEGYMTVKSEEETELFAQVEWQSTGVYGVGFTSVFLNLAGREAKGIVSEEDRESMVEELIEKLLNVKDGSKNVFTNIHRGREVFKGEFEAEAPDLIVGFAPGYRMSWKSALGGLDPEIIFDNESAWCGDHLIDSSHVPGCIFTSFDINKDQPDIIDVAPTVLKLFDVNIPSHVDGEVLI